MTHSQTCPLTYGQVIERYFPEHRAKVLDLAAFLDRLDRSSDKPAPGQAEGQTEDYRCLALRQAIEMLIDGEGDRARRVLESFSDPTEQPIDHAPGKGASGVYDDS